MAAHRIFARQVLSTHIKFDNAAGERHNAGGANEVPRSAAAAPSVAGAARNANMSAPLYEARPMPNPSEQTPVADMGVSSRLIRLDPGLFSLSLMPGPIDRGRGLPAVRMSLPPGPPGRREAVSINTFRDDGWLTAHDEPTLVRVLAGGAEVLVTLYWSATDAAGPPPAMKLVRLNPEAAGGTLETPGGAVGGALPAMGRQQTAGPPMMGPSGNPAGGPAGGFVGGPAGGGLPAGRVAEVVAHVEGVGDVDGRFGDWVGMRGSGRAIEGFSLTPRQGISPEDFEIRAVLGRDWLSPWLPGGSFCGSRGLALPMRGFCLRLHPAAAARFDLACFARFVDGSEVGPVGADHIIASANLAALEAFQVLLRPRMA